MNLSSSRILVTGGTGSFGNRVASQLGKYNPKEIVIFSRDEKKQYEMRKDFPDYRYVIGDVRDAVQLSNSLRGIDVVFHAAALKQVPSCEEHPMEAVKTNVLGSSNLCRAAIDNGVHRVVVLSTDKAVKPINAMGISKAMMEKIVISQNMTNSPTTFSCVRYGNVMGSRGSVIPLFLKQIERQQKLTVTVPNMTRFLMTLDQSVGLVEHALEQARGGEIFVRKSPACSVFNLAKAMVLKYWDGDFDRIEVIGIRAGEKIDEILVNEYEIQRASDEEYFYNIPPEYAGTVNTGRFPAGYEYTSANTEQLADLSSIGHLIDLMGNIETFM